MKKLGITAVLMLLLAMSFGAASAKAVDSTFMVRNDSKTTVTVSIVWSGGNVPPAKLGPGESMEGSGPSIPSTIGSVKMQVTGDCKKGEQTFNPQRVTQVIIHCKNKTYTIALGRDDRKP